MTVRRTGWSLFLTVLLILGAVGQGISAEKLEIKGDYFYWNGEEYFINAVGYSPWRPGQQPGSDKVGLDLIEMDLKRIKEAGFNSIRTWDAFSSEELVLANKYGLKVIQGIWIDPTHDFSEARFLKDSIEIVKKVVEESKGHDNVLMYLVMTEPTPEAVLFAGAEPTLEYFRQIKETIQSIDNKPVSMDSWIPIGFLDHSLWDVTTFNVFMFTPESINKSIGFENYVRWIKENHAKGKPLLIGETGGFSVSKLMLNDIGFGGNTEVEQAQGNLKSLKQCLAAGAAGVCTVSWIDTWHYPSDPNTHDDHPWEWDGFVGFEGQDGGVGIPRQMYRVFQKFNGQALSSELKASKLLSKAGLGETIKIHAPKEIFKTDEVIEVEVKLKTPNNHLPPGHKVVVGFFLPVGWKEEVKVIEKDGKGGFSVKTDLTPQHADQYLIVSAGLWDDGKVIDADIIFIELKGKK